MTFDPLVVGVAVFVAGVVLGLAVADDRKRRADSDTQEFLSCFMRDLKAGRYERK